MKTTQWICDTCGGVIQDAEHGWVEWLSKYDGDKKFGRGLRLVHHYPHSPRSGAHRCQYDGNVEYKKDGCTISDLPLPHLLGADGLMDLLSMLPDEDVPRDEIIEMIKRLHIPGYERARGTFERAISEGVFEPNTKPDFYRQSDILATLKWMDKNEMA